MAQLEYEQYRQLLQDLGKAGLNALFPKDFEYYMMALELVDSDDRVVDYFVFPVMPDSITHSSTSITNVKKTAGGVSVLKNATFIPIDIQMKGSFGRRLRLLVGSQRISFTALRFSTKTGSFSKESATDDGVRFKVPIFNPGVKTGYGATKILEAICDKSQGLDSKHKPYRLYLYNPALGNNYLVEVKNLTLTQDKSSSNMLWQYQLSLTAIAPLDQLKRSPQKSLTKALGSDILQKSVNKFAKIAIDNIPNRAVREFIQ